MAETRPWHRTFPAYPTTSAVPAVSIADMVLATLDAGSASPALVFQGRTLSRAEVAGRIRTMAASFSALGVRAGERVIVCLPNIPQAVIALYALILIGAQPAPIHPLSTSAELVLYAGLVDARVLISLDAFLPRLEEALRGGTFSAVIMAGVAPELRGITSLAFRLGPGRGIPRLPARVGACVVHPWAALERSAQRTARVELPGPAGADAPGLILFSGGSTGKPKAIVLSHRNVNALAVQTNLAGGPVLPGESILAILPVFHGFGLAVGIHAILVHGGVCILVPRFKAAGLASLVRKHRPAYLAGVPSLFDALAADPSFKCLDLSSFKGLFCGGDSLGRATKERFEAVLRAGGCTADLREGYGLTESVTANMLMPQGAWREGSMGIPYPGMDAKIVGSDGISELAPGTEGEICVTGPSVMMGYLDEPEENAQTLRIHPDGRTWLHTGDVGTMDTDGFFYFRQRAKRIIKSSGIAVYPSQVEEVLAAHPAVQLACVIGVPHVSKIEEPMGYVTLKAGFTPSPDLEQDLIAHCRSRLIPHACPRCIEFLAEMPLTRVGKIAFRELEARQAGSTA